MPSPMPRLAPVTTTVRPAMPGQLVTVTSEKTSRPRAARPPSSRHQHDLAEHLAVLHQALGFVDLVERP